jgi:hypothetical protein
MSPSRQPRRPKKSKPSHTRQRHTVDVAPEPSPDPAPPIIEPSLIDQWNVLGVRLASHPHHLSLALHVARAATSGGHITRSDEDALANWFVEILDEGIRRTGGIAVDEHKNQSNAFASAAWYVLHTDSIRDVRRRVRSSRCPAMVEVPRPDAPGFVDALRAAARGYIRTVIAGANQDEIAELAVLRTLDVGTLDERYCPFGAPYTEDVYDAETYERALANLTRRYCTNADICEGMESWACAFAQMAHEADIPPVFRIGVCAWLARTGLRPDEDLPVTAETMSQMIARLYKLGWTLDGPHRVSDGFKATISKEGLSVRLTAATEKMLLEELLADAESKQETRE